MKIKIENLKAKMSGARLNIYQKADALIEFNKLIDYVEELEQLTKPDIVEPSEEFPSREDAYKEGLSRKRRHEKNIVWKAKIFAAGAMWAKMKLTGISDVIGNNN
jgi:hypothetical protein